MDPIYFHLYTIQITHNHHNQREKKKAFRFCSARFLFCVYSLCSVLVFAFFTFKTMLSVTFNLLAWSTSLFMLYLFHVFSFFSFSSRSWCNSSVCSWRAKRNKKEYTHRYWIFSIEIEWNGGIELQEEEEEPFRQNTYGLICKHLVQFEWTKNSYLLNSVKSVPISQSLLSIFPRSIGFLSLFCIDSFNSHNNAHR